MENAELLEIGIRLASLPVLQEKVQILQDKIRGAEEEVNRLLDKYNAESLDVDNLKKDTLRTLIMKNFGRYEDKLDRESEEMLAAKLEYDKACVRLKELQTVKDETKARISVLLDEKFLYDKELTRREAAIRTGMAGEISERYKKLEAEQEALQKRLVEAEEAKSAARRALSTAGDALEHLQSAENWATFDAWTRGGIISHIAKYGHIDDAQEAFNRLNSQLEDLQKELQDLNMPGVSGFDGIDTTTRAVDFWLDNIFTDLSVRARIGDDLEQMSQLRDRISGIVYKLDNDITEAHKKLKALDQKKNDLLVECS